MRLAGEREFTNQWGLGRINAQWAHARGATGDGVTIGVVDNGLDHFHPELSSTDKINPASVLFYENGEVAGVSAVVNLQRYVYPDDPADQVGYTGITAYPRWEDCNNRGVISDPTCYFRTLPASPPTDNSFFRIPFQRETDHGLAIAALAAADKTADPNTVVTNNDILGVAYDAKIRFIIGHFGQGLGGKGVVPRRNIDEQLALLQPLINDDDVPVINMSWGVPLTRADDRALLSNAYRGFRLSRADLLGQTGVTADDKTILVWAAGNSNNAICYTGDHGCEVDAGFSDAEKRQLLGIPPGAPPDEITRIVMEELGGGQTLADVGRFEGTHPVRPAGLPYALPVLRGHSLAVVAIEQTGQIISFSNRCGALPDNWQASQGRHYCLAAPGRVRIPRWNGNTDYPFEPGTSLAAPHVAGAVAVLIDHFTAPDETEPSMGNTAIAQRLLETANREDIYAPDRHVSDPALAYSTIYGAGLLDLNAATEPVGMAMMMAGGTLTGPAVPFSQTRLSAGPAYGDAFSRAFAGTHVAAFDSMLFPFWHPLTSLVDSPPRRTLHYHRARFSPPSRIATHLPGVGTFRLGVKTLPPIPRRAFRRPDATDPARRRPSSLSFRRETASGSVFAAWRSPGSTPLSLRETLPTPLSSEAFTHPFMSLADNGISVGVRAGDLTAAAFTDPDAPSPVHGMALDYALLPYLSAQAGMVSEKGGALGLRPAGAFGGLSTTSTAFTGLKLDAPVSPRWRVLSHAHFGTARPDVSGIGLVKEVSPLLVSAVSVGIAGRGVLTDGDSLTLALSQPLRVERGRVSLVVPTGRTPDGDLRRVGIDAGLAPSGREVAVSAAWTAAVGRAAYVRLAAGASREPGHDASADDAFHALADVSFRF